MRRRRGTPASAGAALEVCCDCGEHLAVVDPAAGLVIWLTTSVDAPEQGRRWSVTCTRCGHAWAGTALQLDQAAQLAHARGRRAMAMRMATPPATPPAELLVRVSGAECDGSDRAAADQRAVTV